MLTARVGQRMQIAALRRPHEGFGDVPLESHFSTFSTLLQCRASEFCIHSSFLVRESVAVTTASAAQSCAETRRLIARD